MSQRKFASITGSLLVRKGDAGPSPAPQRSAPREILADSWTEPEPLAPLAPQAHDMGAGFAHRLTLRVDADRYRRLSIAAAQLQMPMQHLLIAALDNHLAALAENELSGCACMKTEGTCHRPDGPGSGPKDMRRPA